MYMETVDNVLIERALSGDASAFSHLVQRHYDLIFRLGYRMLGHKADAEDLAQDICAALPAKLKGFRQDARFTTWLYRVVTNAALDRLRKRKSQNIAAAGWGEVEVSHRATTQENQEASTWLQQAMTQLNPELRQTVAIVLGEDMTHAEAARVLDVSEGTISWRMSEVKKALRAIANDEERTS